MIEIPSNMCVGKLIGKTNTLFCKGGDNWSNKISIIFNNRYCMHVYRNKTWCDIKEIENRLIKTYIKKCMSRRRRSLMSQFRT